MHVGQVHVDAELGGPRGFCNGIDPLTLLPDIVKLRGWLERCVTLNGQRLRRGNEVCVGVPRCAMDHKSIIGGQ